MEKSKTSLKCAKKYFVACFGKKLKQELWQQVFLSFTFSEINLIDICITFGAVGEFVFGMSFKSSFH